MDHLKLHIPGPVEVSDATWKAMSAPMIGHRSSNFQDLYGKIQPQLQGQISIAMILVPGPFLVRLIIYWQFSYTNFFYTFYLIMYYFRIFMSYFIAFIFFSIVY